MSQQIWFFGWFRCRWKPRPTESTLLRSSPMVVRPTAVILSKSGHRLLLVSVRGCKMSQNFKRCINLRVDSRLRKVKRILRLIGPLLFKRFFWVSSVSLWTSGRISWRKSETRANYSFFQGILGISSTCLCATLRGTWKTLLTMDPGQLYSTSLFFYFNEH